jgi:hypothetical protein
MATFTAEPEEEQLMPTPLGAESSAATKQTMELKDVELVVQGPQGSTKVLRPAITTVKDIWVAITNIKSLLVAVHPAQSSRCRLFCRWNSCLQGRFRVSRDADDGIYEATCILTQCCLWLGSEVSRHLRLSAASGSGLDGFSFSFALTTDRNRTVSEQKSRHEVLGLRREVKSMSAVLDQKLGRIASSMPSGSPVLTPDPWNKSRKQRKRERQQQQATWQEPYVDLDAQAPAPAAVSKGNKGKGKHSRCRSRSRVQTPKGSRENARAARAARAVRALMYISKAQKK